eukprot:m.67064 g.67064  ORF g.67064 m.67064 type:complete len:695 (+) comp13619_c0_seq1:367-2451(+)
MEESGNISDWLVKLKLQNYVDTFASHGIDTLDKAAQLTSDDLTAMGITLQGHRNRILKHLPQQEMEEKEGHEATPSSVKADAISQLDDILGDIANMLGDLDDEDNSEGAEQPQQSSLTVLSGLGDNDLDALLADLCSFGAENDSVIERQPEPAPTVAEYISEVVESPQTEATTTSQAPLLPSSDKFSTLPANSNLVRQPSKRPLGSEEVAAHLDAFRKRLSTTGQISHHDLESLMKEEKIRIAMEKMAAAENQTAVIKVEVGEGIAKTLCIEAKETTFEVCRKLVVKNRFDDSPYWQLVEVCPTLGVEREYEDHEEVAVLYGAWPPFSDYVFNLRVNESKYGLFVKPEDYFPHSIREEIEQTSQNSALAATAKRRLFQEYFSSTSRLPDVKGYAQIKESKKWKKRFCVLRASGIYFSLKGESEASKDLQVYIKFDEYVLCNPLPAFLSKSKAPTESCFVFRPNIRKRTFEAGDLSAMCFADEQDRKIWSAGIRLAMHGSQLREGFEETCKRFEKLAELGAFNPEEIKGFQAPKKKDVLTVNKQLIRKWQNLRANEEMPNVSAATGVEFEDVGDDKELKVEQPSGLEKYNWFHGALPREKADYLFSQFNFAQGCFLVRESSTHAGDFVVSICFDSKPHHYHVKKFEASAGGVAYGLDQGPRFPSLPDLIDFYSRTPDRLPTRLVLEIPRQKASSR